MSQSREFVVMQDGNGRGRATDVPLHEPILAAGDDAAATAVGIAQAKKAGLTDAEIKRLYPMEKPATTGTSR